MLHYLKVWLASARYSIIRTMMFRGDFLVWSLVEFFWMSVNLLLISVIYEHTSTIAGWNKYEMMLLVGTSMLIQRFLMGFFWSSIFEMGRNVRSGNFDFFLAQPGNVMFMATTRKLDPDGLINSLVAGAVVVYAAHELKLSPSVLDVVAYFGLVGAGLVIHYSILILSISAVFWLTSAQGVEGGYFTLTEFSRLPRQAFKGVSEFLFVWMLPVVVVSNAPARTLLHGFDPLWTLWLFGLAAAWFALAVFVFNRGLRRYASASS
ncbi:ABC-2 family transporter protein [Horticoccus sp. 23ND18S-11]|uniref:ABC-2 family transporter protein n=1 Tax=Horticoccus sp. 23ND18S-11 TaxID=3391832 RepID=UPI0039C91F91